MEILTFFEYHRTRNIFFAVVSFITAFVVYALTVAPTASFWDPAEYIAISHTLQIAHPPGSPFFALWGRLFSMFVPAEYVALSINMISVIASSFTIMLLYLVIVRLIEEWRGPADKMDLMDQIGLYAGGLFGSITFIFTHTHWFNAVEAEMYASSMFFTALVVWVALKWSENHDKPRSERWLVLIAYIFGLGIGVHLLNLLALFFVALIIYFKKKDFTFISFTLMGALACLAFLLVYPFTIVNLPHMAGQIEQMTYGLVGPATFMVFVIAVVVYAIHYTQKKGLRTANLVALSYAVILIGYSSYAMVYIRSQAEPAIDENDPSTIEAFVSYLKREQYGDVPLLRGPTYDNRTGRIDRDNEVFFPRRHSGRAQHLDYYANFDSDWQFFWQYQVYHMYLRYFNWNFIGRESDIQDSSWYSGFGETPHSQNPANSGYFYLPLLLGLLGMLYHFRNDWQRAFSVLVLFVMTGLAIIFYLNQSPMEPRERDYAYVGSFFAFSIWIGMGATAVVELLKDWFGRKPQLTYITLGLMFLAVPFWMAKENWPSHDRSNNYVARDYAYNLLNSLEPNAILFTNGDNDTFPLWYLQEVEGVRTDVRVVNLSLLNTDWYIKQLRDRHTHESSPLPIRLTDEEIERLTSELDLHDPGEQVIPVNHALLRTVFGEEDGLGGKNLAGGESAARDLTANDLAGIDGVVFDEVFENQLQSAIPFTIPADSLDDAVRWQLEGRFAGQDAEGNPRYFLQVQDELILELLENSDWMRPIYFANTVSREGQLGLHPYFQFEGKAFRVVPKRRDVGSFGYVDPDVHIDRLKRFRFQEWNNPDVYFDENIRRMLLNYRYGFSQLADELVRRNRLEEAIYWLEYGEEHVPFRPEESDWTLPSLFAYRYALWGAPESAVELAEFSKSQILHKMDWDLRKLDRLENRIAGLEQDIADARARGRTERQRQLQNRIERTENEVRQVVDEISFAVSQLTILQGVYFKTDRDEMARELAMEVNLMTEGRVPMPDSREANREQIDRFNLAIPVPEQEDRPAEQI